MKMHETVNTVKQMQTNFLKIQNLQKELNQKITSIQGEGRSSAWTATAIKDAKKKTEDEMYKALEDIKANSDRLSKHAEFLTDPEFVISQMVLSERKANDPFTPDNPYLETTTRQGLLAEATRMSNRQLATAIRHANETGQAARYYLLAQEMNSRDPKSPGWEGVDLQKVDLKEQKEFVSLFNTAKTFYSESIVAIRELNDARRESIAMQRLTNAHEVASK